jgi:L,D-peptidoglycan transpeptidase YkuD (ErfK/YbiS/YcfS/YnhG family)
MKAKHWLIIVLLAFIAGGMVWWTTRDQGPRIPALFASSLPADCQQVLLVLSPEAESVQAQLWLMECNGSRWQAVAEPIDCTLGHKGLAWGAGEHTASPPAGFRIKQEGDKCSPAGVFRVPFAFGTATSAPELKLPYTALTPTIIGVDDVKSRYYNQIVDNTKVERDWDSNEAMVRHDKLYEWGAFIAHNPACTPGLGSCIFLHLWPGPGRGTAGCTAMGAEDLKRVLTWMDAVKEPRLVQGVMGW